MNKSSGEISKIVLILAGVVFVIAVVVFVSFRITATRRSETSKKDETPTQKNEPQKPVYEATVGDIRFVMQLSVNMGNTLITVSSIQKDLTTTERFIKITIGAQNKGKISTGQGAWSIGNIIDSEGRNFVPISQGYNFLPRPDLCGDMLKPEFELVPCTKIYEVSKKSKGLKIQITSKVPRQASALLDLNLFY